MIKVRIPKSTPTGGDLKVLIKIGKQGFARSEIWREGEWEPNQEIYVDNDTVSVEFTKVGKINWKETVNINPF